MWQTILGSLLAVARAALLLRQLAAAARRRRDEPERLFSEARAVLENPAVVPGATAGVHELTGRYKGHAVQVKLVADTLALRKLPSLWLMVTLPGPLPVAATLDLMMRPTGPTSFSNFDHLPFSVAAPADFPEHAVIRSDDPARMLPPEIIAGHLDPFYGPRAKELLISPKGLRMVSLMAEADRARYGVFRQADFGEALLDPGQLTDCLDRLIALRTAIESWHKRVT
ncbi:MAG: hypothetical protein ACKOED_03940 [Aestuariivirga sp.]|uniref:hypothetical protein n=1 Tax=Aestuariivirga sp. TaxID=2650926 RepID=UPI0038D20CF6